MRVFRNGGKALMFLTFAAASSVPGHSSASALHHHKHVSTTPPSAHHLAGNKATALHLGHSRHVAFISCVPFARGETGMEISGNAWQWWDNSAGTYARGARPEVGAVLAFQSNSHMPLGHVAVVSGIIGPRRIQVDQANWPHGGIQRGTEVVDVSANNDWTAVRVEIGRDSDRFGSIYPTYGFIYDRPDRGVVLAAATTAHPAPLPDLNPAPHDLRAAPVDEELAEAPDDAAPRAAAPHPAVHRPHHSVHHRTHHHKQG